MAKVNEQLIREVFDAMVKQKPVLSKYLLIDEDEEDEDIDVRLLADQLIKNMPWPIGVELRRLFSGSMRELDRGRLDQLFKTIERTMQFLSFIMIIELYEEIRSGRYKPDPTFIDQFKNRFFVLSMGNFAWFVRSIGNIFQKSGVDYYMPEMAQMFDNKFYDALDFWVPERNEIGHYQINLNEEEIEKRCVEYEEKLTFILVKLSFLVKYKLVTIREINVKKSRDETPMFEHHMDILNSSDSDFRTRDETFDSFSDSHAVLLMRNIKEPTSFLNLTPLIIDTRTETIDSKEKFNLKKDIFMYTKFRNDKIFYLGTEVTEKCDLTNLSNYNELVGEFLNILRYMENKQEG